MFGFTKGLVLFVFPQNLWPKVLWLTEICTHSWLQCTKKQTTSVSHLSIQRWAWKSEAGRPGLALVSKRSTFGLNVVLVLASSTLKWSERCAGASFISSKKTTTHKQVPPEISLTCTHPKLRWNCATSNNASKNQISASFDEPLQRLLVRTVARSRCLAVTLGRITWLISFRYYCSNVGVERIPK